MPLLNTCADSRVEKWPLMQSPMPTIALCLMYVYVVKFAGPCFMKNRPAYNIRAIMVVYNFAMVLLSLYLFLKLGFLGWFGKYDYKCQPVDYSDSDNALEVSTGHCINLQYKLFSFAIEAFFMLHGVLFFTFLALFYLDGQPIMVLLYLEIPRVYGHIFFRCSKKVHSYIDFARDSPRSNAHECVVGSEVHARYVRHQHGPRPQHRPSESLVFASQAVTAPFSHSLIRESIFSCIYTTAYLPSGHT